MAFVDDTQDFTAAWNVGESSLSVNDTPYPSDSLEGKFWPMYKQLFMGVMLHAENKDLDGLRWHLRTFEILMEKIQDMIAGIDAEK